MALKYVFKGKSMGETSYDLLLDGIKVGFATASVTRNATGFHRLRGTSYAARAFDKWFYGSRTVVTREIERHAAGKPLEVSV